MDLDTRFTQALARFGPAIFLQTLVLHDLFNLQFFSVAFERRLDSHHIHQLGFSALYVGRGQTH